MKNSYWGVAFLAVLFALRVAHGLVSLAAWEALFFELSKLTLVLVLLFSIRARAQRTSPEFPDAAPQWMKASPFFIASLLGISVFGDICIYILLTRK